MGFRNIYLFQFFVISILVLTLHNHTYFFLEFKLYLFLRLFSQSMIRFYFISCMIITMFSSLIIYLLHLNLFFILTRIKILLNKFSVLLKIHI